MSAVKEAPAQEIHPISVYAVLMMGIIAISFAAIFIRYAQNDGVPSILIAGSRLVIAAIILTPFTLRRYIDEIRMISRSEWILLSASGIFLALHFAFWVTSLEHTTVLISVTLVTTTPIWTALLEYFVLNMKLRQALIIGLVIALIGGVMTGIPSETTNLDVTTGNATLGAILATAGAIAVAVYLTIGRKVRAKLSLLPYIWIVYGIAGIALSVVIIFQRVPLTGYSWVGYTNILALATIPQLIGHSSMNYVVKYLSATYISIASKLEPIGSAILAYFLFVEIPNMWQIIGSIVISIGVVIASFEQKPRKVKTSKA